MYMNHDMPCRPAFGSFYNYLPRMDPPTPPDVALRTARNGSLTAEEPLEEAARAEELEKRCLEAAVRFARVAIPFCMFGRLRRGLPPLMLDCCPVKLWLLANAPTRCMDEAE